MRHIFRHGLIILTASIILFSLGSMEHHYTRHYCQVISSERGLVTARDSGGEDWTFYGDFSKGEYLHLKMYDNCSLEIWDDEVIGAKRA